MDARADHRTAIAVGAVSRSERTAALSAAALAVAAMTLHAWIRGALGAARNDDWAYLRVAQRFASGDGFSLDGWTQMAFIGQAVVTAPIAIALGSSITAFQLSVGVMAAVGLAVMYLLLRSFTDTTAAIVGVAVVAVGPLFSPLAVSYMTDVPSFCAAVCVLLTAVRLTERFSVARVVALCTLSVVAVSLREYNLVLVVAALGVLVATARTGPDRRRLLVGAGTTAVVVALIIAWRWRLPHSLPTTLRFDLEQGSRAIGRAVFAAAFLVMPAVPLLPLRACLSRARSAKLRIAAAIVLWAAIGVLSELRWPGNYISPFGPYAPLIEGQLPRVWSPRLDLFLRVSSYVALLAVLLVACVRARVPEPLRHWKATSNRAATCDPAALARAVVVVPLVALFVTHCVLLVVSDAPFFDRYLVVFIPVLAALIAASRERLPRRVGLGRAVGAGVVAAVFALASSAMIDAAATLDGAQWEAGEQLVDNGYDAAAVDSGFAWFGFHQVGPVAFDFSSGRNWWISMYPDRAVCVTVVVGAPPDPTGVVADSGLPIVATTWFGATYSMGTRPGPSACPTP